MKDILKLLALTLLATVVAPAAAARPNVIVILADDLGCGDMSLHNGWIKTPRIDQMAREGVRFADFHSNSSVCSATRSAFLTGRYQQRVGIIDVIARQSVGRILDALSEHGLEENSTRNRGRRQPTKKTMSAMASNTGNFTIQRKTTMKRKTMSLEWLKGHAGLAAGLLLAASAATGAEKQQVFIQSGQSNMVGHADPVRPCWHCKCWQSEDTGVGSMAFCHNFPT